MHPWREPHAGDNTTVGDRHVLVLDRDACLLYELYNAHVQASGC